MKIGILTFHSQLNYGGVLQCWALQTALERMGHEVVVIDRWHNPDNSLLECGYNKFGLKQWIKLLIRLLLGLGDFSQWQRIKRTKKFLKAKLNLTPYHFVDWNDAPKDLSVDLLVVGSDQVWHCGDWGDPRPYLLDGAPKIPAIAYATSLGMKSLPERLGEKDGLSEIDTETFYRTSLKKFKAISCREREGVDICSSLAFQATHVVDPTLLAYDGETKCIGKSNRLVCYFMDEPIVESLVALETFAKKMDCSVEIFSDRGNLRPIPKTPRMLASRYSEIIHRIGSRVKIRSSAGPKEFYDSFKSATYVISDSFHALMFSILNNCNARIIRPSNAMRSKMFSRITEFADHTTGSLISNSLQEAIASISAGERVVYDSEWLQTRVEFSKNWLEANIK